MQGCELLVIEENTNEYLQLSEQYNEYVKNDIVDFDDFKTLMNNASNIAATSTFMIETNGLDLFNRIINTHYGTGTLFFEDAEYLYILTTAQVIDLNSRKVNYFATDAYGEQLTAEVFATDSTLGLAILRVEQNSNHYEISDFATYMPLTDELVLMISHSYPIQSIQKLGRFLNQDETFYIQTTSTQNANGSPVFNLQLEIIGIQYTFDDTYVQIIDYEAIDNFIRPLLPNA
jgi:S1-C subfamily serine protease